MKEKEKRENKGESGEREREKLEVVEKQKRPSWKKGKKEEYRQRKGPRE